MRLVDLEPEWILDDNRTSPMAAFTGALLTRRLVGILFRCPCARCRGDGCMLGIRFANPIGGGPASPRDDDQIGENEGRRWRVVAGDSFETLTIEPSIDASAAGCWHGFIRNGVCT